MFCCTFKKYNACDSNWRPYTFEGLNLKSKKEGKCQYQAPQHFSAHSSIVAVVDKFAKHIPWGNNFPHSFLWDIVGCAPSHSSSKVCTECARSFLGQWDMTKNV